MRPILLLLSIPLIIGCATPGGTVSSEKPAEKTSAETGTFELELETVDGDTFSFADIRGKKHLFIAFWATWCEPCKTELARLRNMYPRYRNSIEFVAVAIDTEDTLGLVQEQAVEMMLPFPILIDPSGNTVQSMVPGGDTVPYSMLVSKHGKTVYTHSGYTPGDEAALAREFDRLLSEK